MKSFVYAALFVGAAALMPIEGNTLEIVFGGGYAFIVTQGNTLDIATIKKPNVFSTNYMHHPLKLAVVKGTIDLAKTTVPPIALGHGPLLGWDFTGRTVQVLDGNQEFPSDKITLPAYKQVADCGDVGASEVNNRYFLPDIPKIAGQQALNEKFDERFNGRITLHGGTLAVTRLSPGCFKFVEDGATVRTQRVADGIAGVTYTHPLSGSLMLRVFEKGKSIGDIAIVPNSENKVRLEIHSRHDAKSTPGPIKSFKYFYWLLREPAAHEEIPDWDGKTLQATPGEACPPGFYEIQSR